MNYMETERTEIELEATVLLKIKLNRTVDMYRSLGTLRRVVLYRSDKFSDKYDSSILAM